jgi:hypothetical protein
MQILAIVLFVLLRLTDSDYSYDIYWPLYCLSFDLRILITPMVSIGHCIVCHSSIYGWPIDTIGVIRISKSKKNRQYNGQ